MNKGNDKVDKLLEKLTDNIKTAMDSNGFENTRVNEIRFHNNSSVTVSLRYEQK